jgi:hypothetical protein
MVTRAFPYNPSELKDLRTLAKELPCRCEWAKTVSLK